MRRRSLRFTLGLVLLASRGLGQQDEELQPEAPVDEPHEEVTEPDEPATTDTEPEIESDESASASPKPKETTEAAADEAGGQRAPEPREKQRLQKEAANELPASSEGAPTAPAQPTTPVLSDWAVTLYGYAALTVIHDSTQSFTSGVHNNILARRGTFESQHSQLMVDTRDSRIGLRVRAAEYEGMRASMRGEMDFRAAQSPDNTEEQVFTKGTLRMRHLFMRLETPIVDVLAGQYHNLFGWGGSGFFPATLAFLGVVGQVFDRQGQLRLSKTLGGESIRFEMAVAGTRPASSASGVPDLQAGLRLGLPFWTGARTQGYGQPGIGELSLGVSGVLRYFEVAEFTAAPADSVEATGGGVVVNAFVPIIPASSAQDRGNALSVTAEASYGTGISDMYTELTGGALFPTLPNPTGEPFPTTPYYVPNIDSGIVTFDENLQLRTIDWQGLVLGAQYYLPIDSGRVWLAGIYSQVRSANIVELTPVPNRGLVFDKAEYIDGSLFVAVTNSVQMGVSFQTVKQTFGDGATARNNRSMGAAHFFF